ncbi:SpoIIE family protein phosphatase [Pelagibaculum spongiae]|uniref:Fused response regulator/phosphatase n=1 Tax=Pelagibaculum spongiae TaxID=2080658 RepID=A0A2V1GX02_9GAMM|nr:SpoIIE family protein phosphatase [Pelagibaculum spongiae]PVZ64313.1 fused response regulator/phosphatase [Pelagibaculum spongiae]
MEFVEDCCTPARILTIDDEKVLRESIVAYLEDSGFEMMEASDGLKGLAAFRDNKPDLVLCDLRMPEMDGLDVLAVLQKESPETPVIMVSGAGILSDAVEALRLGAWDYLVKPIADMAVLEHAVRASLQKARLIKENNLYKARLEKANRELEESLKRLEEDQEAGRKVQMQLLPENGSLCGIDFTHRVIPSLYLSGDFVDYFKLSESQVAFYVADVSGHGASSAFVTVHLKTLFNEMMKQQDGVLEQPIELLTRLNNDVLESRLGKYLTMVYGVIDTESNVLKLGFAGHFPHPVFSTGGKARYIEQAGFPVGVFEGAEYMSLELELPDAFSLNIFSDGVLEVMQEQGLANKEAYLLGLVDQDNQTADQICQKLGVSDMDVPPDDITVLTIQRKG